MLCVKEIVFLICIIFCLHVKTLQKELGISHDAESDDWTQMKWDSILKDASHLEKSDNLSKDDSENLDPLLSSQSEPMENLKNKVKLDESELENFSNDEVFAAGENMHSKPSIIKSVDVPVVQVDQDGLFNLPVKENFLLKNPDSSEEFLPDDINQNIGLVRKPETELDGSQVLASSSQSESSAGPHIEADFLNSRSFIFNPMAQPQEQFQNCTTPKNETGKCRYLQHCMIPTIVSSLAQFMDYVCIIEGRFIGVCCPILPVSVVVVQKLEDSEQESNLDGECGVATNTRIVGGSNADPKAFPWMVALFSKFRKRFFCGGALINDRYVLTAAHCTFGISNNEIIARVGEYDFKDDGESHDDYAVVEMKRHGHYNRRTLRNDIALLKLEKSVVFNEFIKSICFPEVEKSYIGEKATLAGWGNIKGGGGETSHILQVASFPIISNEECSKGHGLPISESLICTGAEAGDKGACNGDSGGPLMLLDRNNRWKVIGLVSWGRRGCNPEFPTVYTRVSHFMDWIRKHSK